MSNRAESSKKASKRAARDRNAIEASLMNDPHSGVHISDESNQFSGDVENTPSMEESQKNKKKRGPTRCSKLAVESGKRLEVKFNVRGQMIGTESVKLSSYLGVMSRMIQVSYDKWKLVPQEQKDDIWELITQKFIIDEGQYKTYIIQLLGKLWRTQKSRLMAQVEACEDDIVTLKPDNLNEIEWKNFISTKSSQEAMEKRAKFKEMRSKQVLSHTCSRKGYARLEDDMRKESPTPDDISRVGVWTRGHTKINGEPVNLVVAEHLQKLQEIKQSSLVTSLSTSLKDDALSQLLGPERRGRVRGVGFGVTPSKVGALTQSNSKVTQLEHVVLSMQEEMQGLKKLVATLVNNHGNQESSYNVEVPQTTNSVVLPSVSTSTPMASTTPSKLQGINCKIFMMVKENIIAEGRWVTDDPNILVPHVPLGSGTSKVWIDHVLEPMAMLWRKTSDLKRMEDAMGSTIAWPTDQIIKEDPT